MRIELWLEKLLLLELNNNFKPKPKIINNLHCEFCK